MLSPLGARSEASVGMKLISLSGSRPSRPPLWRKTGRWRPRPHRPATGRTRRRRALARNFLDQKGRIGWACGGDRGEAKPTRARQPESRFLETPPARIQVSRNAKLQPLGRKEHGDLILVSPSVNLTESFPQSRPAYKLTDIKSPRLPPPIFSLNSVNAQTSASSRSGE